MRFQRIIAVTFCSFSLFLNAQKSAPENPLVCGQQSQQEKIYQLHPEQRIQDSIDGASFEVDYQNYLATYDPNSRSTYTIPVVVHVVHLNGEENISDNQIYDAIEKLNEDYSMSNFDIGNTFPAFAGIVGNGDIEFKLASIDPDGNCHSGITRTYSSTTFDTGISGGGHPIVDAVANLHGVWPQGQYMSIFVCIDPIGAAGYTYNPGNFFNSNEMYGAIFMRHDYMGVIGTGSSSRRHTLGHEAGHWLNLSHVWGSTNNSGLASNCSSDDGVTDTPNTIGSQGCTATASSCGSVDNVQNIMEYSSCRTMFTQGQVARMHTALNSSTAGRSNLITSTNLSSTGISLPASLCKADFISDETVICQGESVQFSDISFYGVTSRSWTFAGGSPSTSSDSVVDVVFNTPGVYAVSVNISDGSTTIVETKTNFIVVLSDVGAEAPIQESYEANPNPENRFFTSSQNSFKDWEVSQTVASLGSNSIFYNNYQKGTGGSEVSFESGAIDLSNLESTESLIFTFDYAYRKREFANDEWLRVFVSKDCGQTWIQRKVIHGNVLSNQISSGNFQASPEDFETVSLSGINSSFYVPNFRYKFLFEADGGNNIFIDNINIFGENSLNISESATESQITLYPNPVLDLLQVQTENSTMEAYKIMNASGQLISYETQPSIGTNRILTIDTKQLPSGIYYLSIINQRTNTIKKFIKQ